VKNKNYYAFSFFLIMLCNFSYATPLTLNISGSLDSIYVADGANDTHNLGIHSVALGDAYSLSITYDNDPSVAAYTDIQPNDVDFEFNKPSHGWTFTLNGNTIAGGRTGTSLGDNVGSPPVGGVDQFWLDNGFTLPLANPIDFQWIGAWSDDREIGLDQPLNQGLLIGVGFFDINGNKLSNLDIPGDVPNPMEWSFVVFEIEQYDLGVLSFKAFSLIHNELLAVPEPSTYLLMLCSLILLTRFKYKAKK